MILQIKQMAKHLLAVFMILRTTRDLSVLELVRIHRNLLLPRFAGDGMRKGKICINMLNIYILLPMVVAATEVEIAFGKRGYRHCPMKRD
jgi:hypothetical protein